MDKTKYHDLVETKLTKLQKDNLFAKFTNMLDNNDIKSYSNTIDHYDNCITAVKVTTPTSIYIITDFTIHDLTMLVNVKDNKTGLTWQCGAKTILSTIIKEIKGENQR